jgi:hypothetical protein
VTPAEKIAQAWACTQFGEAGLAKDIQSAIDAAVDEELRCAAERALTLMHQLNTDYRFEIEETILARGAK